MSNDVFLHDGLTPATDVEVYPSQAIGDGTFTGTAAVNIDAPAIAAAGLEIEDVTGTGAVTILAPVILGSVRQLHVGSAVQIIDAPSAAGTGKETFTGTATPSVDAPSVAASGTGNAAVTGTAAISIAAPAIAAAGASTSPAPPVYPSGVPAWQYVKPIVRPLPITGRGGIRIDAPMIVAFGFVWDNEDWLLGLPSDSYLVTL